MHYLLYETGLQMGVLWPFYLRAYNISDQNGLISVESRIVALELLISRVGWNPKDNKKGGPLWRPPFLEEIQ